MNTESFPANAIAAVTHPDPYPYYEYLVTHTPLFRDAALGLWVASSAEAVVAALTNDACRVRPLDEPVPKALVGSPAADIFGRLIRMNDGGGHCPFNRAVADTLASVDTSRIAEHSMQWAKRLHGPGPIADLSHVTDYAFRLSVHVIGSLLGVADEKLTQVSEWTGDFVRCVFPASTPEQVEQGKAAAARLFASFREILDSKRNATPNLLTTLAREAERVGRADRDVIIANGIGFLSQAYEATAGLISNTLLASATRHDVREQVNANPDLLRDFIFEVLRFDPPTHNTRRFITDDCMVAGQSMKAGDVILVVVAAANRDPAANPEPNRFELQRQHRRIFTFGAGVHACPGEIFATTIAQAGIATLLDTRFDVTRLQSNFTYRTSANTRIPLFTSKG
ncbi:MAG TPA: cytochrome P450 [Steroidobacteraceae bacterium]|nr:cytochrome P450 [Steroidobacteraceae bacterium]